jgi:hypothetical protein
MVLTKVPYHSKTKKSINHGYRPNVQIVLKC